MRSQCIWGVFLLLVMISHDSLSLAKEGPNYSLQAECAVEHQDGLTAVTNSCTLAAPTAGPGDSRLECSLSLGAGFLPDDEITSAEELSVGLHLSLQGPPEGRMFSLQLGHLEPDLGRLAPGAGVEGIAGRLPLAGSPIDLAFFWGHNLDLSEESRARASCFSRGLALATESRGGERDWRLSTGVSWTPEEAAEGMGHRQAVQHLFADLSLQQGGFRADAATAFSHYTHLDGTVVVDSAVYAYLSQRGSPLSWRVKGERVGPAYFSTGTAVTADRQRIDAYASYRVLPWCSVRADLAGYYDQLAGDLLSRTNSLRPALRFAISRPPWHRPLRCVLYRDSSIRFKGDASYYQRLNRWRVEVKENIRPLAPQVSASREIRQDLLSGEITCNRSLTTKVCYQKARSRQGAEACFENSWEVEESADGFVEITRGWALQVLYPLASNGGKLGFSLEEMTRAVGASLETVRKGSIEVTWANDNAPAYTLQGTWELTQEDADSLDVELGISIRVKYRPFI